MYIELVFKINILIDFHVFLQCNNFVIINFSVKIKLSIKEAFMFINNIYGLSILLLIPEWWPTSSPSHS